MVKMKRLILDVDEDLHKEIKVRSAVRNISMRKYIIKAIMKQIKKEEKYD